MNGPMRICYQKKGTKAYCPFCHDYMFKFDVDVYFGEMMDPKSVSEGQSPFAIGDQLACKKCGKDIMEPMMEYRETDSLFGIKPQEYKDWKERQLK